jgi:hypothetical protein
LENKLTKKCQHLRNGVDAASVCGTQPPVVLSRRDYSSYSSSSSSQSNGKIGLVALAVVVFAVLIYLSLRRRQRRLLLLQNEVVTIEPQKPQEPQIFEGADPDNLLAVMTKEDMNFLFSKLKPGYIRVIDLSKDQEKNKILCRLRETKWDDGGYEALSYVWSQTPLGNEKPGAPGKIFMIKDGMEVKFPVSWNLMRALHHLSNRPRTLWVDQICINQHKMWGVDDNNMQVPLMSEIYQRAEQVVAWIGEADHVKAAFRTGDSIECKREAIRNLARRKYWTRMWIVQEIVLAKVDEVGRHCLTFQCDDCTMSYEELEGICEKIQPTSIAPADVYSIFPEIAVETAEAGIRSRIRPVQMLRKWRHDKEGKKEMVLMPMLLKLVQWARNIDSTEGVDRVLALKALVVKLEFDKADPAYKSFSEKVNILWGKGLSILAAVLAMGIDPVLFTISAAMVQPGMMQPEKMKTMPGGLRKSYAGVLLAHLDLQKRLDGLNCHTGRGPETILPSWVPDFAAKPTSYSLIDITTDENKWFIWYDPIWKTGMAQAPDCKHDGEGTLTVKGVRFGVIKDWSLEFCPKHELMTSINAVHHELRMWSEKEEVKGKITEWKKLSRDKRFNRAIRRVVSGHLQVEGPHGFTCDEAALDELEQKDYRCTKPLKKMVQRYPEAMLRTMLNRRLFRTEDGRIGAGPSHMEKDEIYEICILYGAQTPYVIRRTGKTWMFIGECFIDGWMGENALEDWKRCSSNEEEDFIFDC